VDNQGLEREDFARWWRETGEYELRQVLYWKWDPLGMNDAFPNTADEYDGYAPEVVSLLTRDASPAEIVGLLATIERERMGLERQRTDQLQALVSELSVWFEHSQSRWSDFGPVRR
jgi:hypothetical protein